MLFSFRLIFIITHTRLLRYRFKIAQYDNDSASYFQKVIKKTLRNTIGNPELSFGYIKSIATLDVCG